MEPRVIQIGNYRESEDRKFDNPQCGRVYSVDGLSPTINTCQGGDREPKILLKMEKEIIPYNTPEDGVAPTITTMYARLGTNNLSPGEYGGAMGIMEISKDTMEEKEIKGVSVHPLSHKLEFDGNINEEVSPCLRATDYKAPHCVWEEEPKSCASRKRGDEHKIETRKDELANCVTSIDTDSMVQEPLKIPQATKQGYIECPVGGVFDASYPDSDKRRGRVQENGEVSPALTTNSEGAILRYEGKEEPSILAVERTEEAKELRKKGIAHFKDKQHKPRTDGLSNCITSCLKDNLLQEPNGTEYKGKFIKEWDGLYTDTTQEFFRGGLDGVSRTLKAETHDAGTCVMKGARYRIRKLTPVEVGRLMGMEDEDIQKMIDAGISKTNLYKLFGNSIVIDVLYHIFRKLFIEIDTEDQQLSLF